MASRKSETIEVSDERKHPFYIVDNDMIAVYGAKIGVYGIAVYNVLAYYANKKDTAWPSYQTIADHLGISRPKVVSTIRVLVANGLIKKEARYSGVGDQASNKYLLVSIHPGGSKQDLPPLVNDTNHLVNDVNHPPVNDVNHPSKPRLPEQDPMNNTQSFEQDPMRESAATQPPAPIDVDFSESDSIPAQPATERPLTPQQAMYGAICEALGWDYHVIAEREKVRVAQTVKILSKAIPAYTVDDIRRFMVEVWFKDWRWEKHRQYPTLEQLRQEIGKTRSVAPSAAPPPTTKGINSLNRLAASIRAGS